MSEIIPLSVPCIRGNEWIYVKKCLDDAWVSSAGPYIEKFEKVVAEFTKAHYAIACVNGTSALHVALLLAGIRPEDEVLVPTLTFIAPVNAIRYLNANPVFMDCDEFYNIDIEKTIDFIEKETQFKDGKSYDKTTQKRVAAIMPVHVFGNAANLAPLLDICYDRNIPLIEDATESLGTFYREGRTAGKHAGTIGLMGCLSFNGNKIITTGGGGMILTDDPQKAEKAKYLTTQAKNDAIRYIHDEIGFNYRMTNIQAAIGVAQFESLPAFVDIKRRNYERYKRDIDGIAGLHLAETPEYADNNHWMYALQIDKATYGKDREELMRFLDRRNIQTRPVWQANHLQRPYTSFRTYRLELAPEMIGKTLNIPCSVNLKDEDMDLIVGFLRP